ncbi:hypothetical protein PBY51_013751 [Eleginops maclovinus]|uniref:Protein FAM217B n=1 Tax=Eleginops maclovinus TaxID=56733 RepID=A0AAN7YCE0_ELEMC|nr:hypothetical protein PBY51_013751 [Eleginops maclovinus]
MGTILQERAPQQHPERVSIRDRKNNNTPYVPSSRMGRRQSQRKPVQPQYTLPSQENSNEKRLQQRRKQKPNPPSTKRATSHHRSQGSSESKTHPLSPAEDRTSQHREHKHSVFRTSRHTAAFPCHRPSTTSPDPQDGPSEVGSPSFHGEGDSDSDLSESERLPVASCSRVPPQLHLRPEVIEVEDRSSRCHRPRGHGLGAFDFPDFLPPPFNSWSLSQLAVFYNTEGQGAPRPRAVGPLERYMERLLQLEWRQIQTAQEEGGKSGAVGYVVRLPRLTCLRLVPPQHSEVHPAVSALLPPQLPLVAGQSLGAALRMRLHPLPDPILRLQHVLLPIHVQAAQEELQREPGQLLGQELQKPEVQQPSEEQPHDEDAGFREPPQPGARCCSSTHCR